MSDQPPTAEGESLAELLRERDELEQRLRGLAGRHLAVMFTDIKGSTAFFETRGDV